MGCSTTGIAPTLRGSPRVLITVVAASWMLLTSCRVSPVYEPERYEPSRWERIPPTLVVLRYRIDQGEQISFYRPPASGGEPERLWMMFSGQGGTALEWPGDLAGVADREAGFLLLDYPGSGFCRGSPTPGRILAASEAAAESLRRALGWTPERCADRLGVFGYSLGAAMALQYAARHEVRRIIIAAPFTTLAEIGNLFYGWPSGDLLRDRLDNAARLAEIAQQIHRPPLVIVHGDLDDTIPVGMSARLAAPYPAWIARIVVPGADHDAVVPAALRQLDAR
jgi:pimeloyl-ACP methyl ester carboxylesterase